MHAFLTGEKILLRSLEPDDLDLFYSWFADREATRYSLGAWLFPWSKHETETWLQQTNDPTGHKGLFLFRWTANDLSFPIQSKRLLAKTLPLTNRPGFAIDLQFIATLPYQMAA